MDTASLLVLLIAIATAAVWLRRQLINHQSSRCNALVFLSLHSLETEDVLGISVPSSMVHLSKAVSLRSQPAPGIELDGLGTGPLQVLRAVIDDGAAYDIFLQLAPLIIAAEDIEPYAASLVSDMDWRHSEMTPPYPAAVPNNSFKPKPLRGSA